MNEYEEYVEIRDTMVDGIGPWMVRKNDEAFDGIIEAWNKTNKNTYLRHIKKFDVCLVAGGYNGLIPRLFSEHFSYVYTMEPESINFHCLVNNTQKPNIYKFNCALGRRHEFIYLSDAPATNPGMFRVQDNIGMIPQLKIDDFTFPRLDFILLDVESYELNVLKGAEETIKKFKPTISCEVEWLDSNGLTILENYLSEFGYNCIDQCYGDRIYTVN